MAFFEEWKSVVYKLSAIQQCLKITGDKALSVIEMMKLMDTQETADRLLTLFKIIQFIVADNSKEPIGLQNSIFSDITKNMYRIQIILKYVVDNYKTKVSLSEIASMVSMTDTAFCAFFKRETGRQFISFVNEYRLESACSMLKNFPDMDIKNIAWECGFSDIPYFNRYFKKIKNMSPRQWRNKLSI